MSLSLIEGSRSRNDSQRLREELIRTLRKGELRTVIIIRTQAGDVLNLVFPRNDKDLQDKLGIAACELVPLVEDTVPGCNHKQTLFGHLRIKDNEIFVHSASDSKARRVDPQEATELVQRYLA